jgi:pimeloyl-ACP methyl ester carboxylesterase
LKFIIIKISFRKMDQMAGGMDMLVNMIIRPPRNEYPSDAAHHGTARSFADPSKKFVKNILTLTNDAGEKLSCMFYEPIPEQRPAEKMPVVIYMHGNAGCRLEAESYAGHLLE